MMRPKHVRIDQEAKEIDTRTCTCHPDDNPPIPCPRKFALRECRRSAVLDETQRNIVAIKNRDQAPHETALLGYLMRVRDALEL